MVALTGAYASEHVGLTSLRDGELRVEYRTRGLSDSMTDEAHFFVAHAEPSRMGARGGTDSRCAGSGGVRRP